MLGHFKIRLLGDEWPNVAGCSNKTQSGQRHFSHHSHHYTQRWSSSTSFCRRCTVRFGCASFATDRPQPARPLTRLRLFELWVGTGCQSPHLPLIFSVPVLAPLDCGARCSVVTRLASCAPLLRHFYTVFAQISSFFLSLFHFGTFHRNVAQCMADAGLALHQFSVNCAFCHGSSITDRSQSWPLCF